MPDPFDPYYKWLGIPPSEQPPNHYRLFGLANFEMDADVIAAGAARTIRYLRDVAAGPNSEWSQQLLNEAAAARSCLLSVDKKADYDRQLKEELAPPTRKPPPVPKQPRRQKLSAAGSPESSHRESTVVVVPSKTASSKGRVANPPTRPKGRTLTLFAIAGVVAAMLLIAATQLNWRRALDAAGQAAKPELSQRAAPKKRVVHNASGSSANGVVDKIAVKPIVDAAKPSQTPPQNDRLVVKTPSSLDPRYHPTHSNVSPPAVAPRAVDVAADAKVPRDGLILWLDAHQLELLEVDEEGRVAQWFDVLRPSRKGFQSEAERQPRLIEEPGDIPRLRFSKPQFLEVTQAADFDVQDRFTIVTVARGDQGVLLSKGSALEEGGFAMWNAVNCFRIGGDLRLDAKDERTDEFRIRVIVGAPGELSWYIDGQPCGRHDQPHRIEIAEPLRIGRRYRRRGGPQGNFEGELAELLIFDRPLDEGDRSAVEEYLEEKWFPDQRDSHDESALLAATSSGDAPKKPPKIEPFPDPKIKPSPPPPDFELRVNVGGEDVVDQHQRVWKKSPDWDGSGYGHENGSRASFADLKHSIYGTAIRGLTAFRAVVPNGRYMVELHFSEHWTSDIKRRTFAIAAERKPVLRPPLTFQGPGMGQPFVYRIPNCVVVDGQLDLEFATFHKDSKSILNAIEIRRIAGLP